jgi:hypothetical protein
MQLKAKISFCDRAIDNVQEDGKRDGFGEWEMDG